MSNNYDIEKRRKELGLTLEAVGKYVGVGKSTVKKWETGYIENMKRDKIALLAKVLKVSPLEIMGISPEDLRDINVVPFNQSIGTPYNPIIHEIPILGRIAAGLPLYAEEHIEGYTYTEHNGGAEYFALRVKGDSMNAAQISDGSTIIVRRQPEVENGEIAVVRVNKEDATVKRFKKEGNIVQLIPQSYNPKHDIQIYNTKETYIEVIGKVVECKVEF
ncbi:MAG: helix-turn-helix domain-containing protein [Ruminococcaceae bacterium]|nr:helix-turn-helix domain-containing protein [Oscillospiraceae bacterium]